VGTLAAATTMASSSTESSKGECQCIVAVVLLATAVLESSVHALGECVDFNAQQRTVVDHVVVQLRRAAQVSLIRAE
jgi:hypothetical protein